MVIIWQYIVTVLKLAVL